MEDRKIIDLLRDKKQEGLDALIEYYGPLMRYIIRPILPDYREQEECLSDATYCIWEKINMYNEDKGDLKTWISVITRNIACNRAKRIKRKGEFGEITADMMAESGRPEEEILKKEKMHMLYIALSELSARDKQLIYRKYYYMQSTEQIAAELGLTVRAVEGRLYRLKKKLRGKCHE